VWAVPSSAPRYRKFAEKHNLELFKVNVDECPSIKEKLSPTKLPFAVVVKDGKVVVSGNATTENGLLDLFSSFL
jgi:hypothetical protein